LVEVVLSTLGLFFFAALLEIGGGYLVWKWLKDHKTKIFGLIGALILFSYGIAWICATEHNQKSSLNFFK